MKDHPKYRLVAGMLRLAVGILLTGCSNQPMSASNPFMAPDRVPPPATHPIAPGTAAPYYPGDPMPAAQIAPPAATPIAQAQPPANPLVTPQIAPPTTPKPLEFANERTVAIPSDDAQLRFPLPAPPPAPAPVAQSPPPPAPPVAATTPVVPAAFQAPVAAAPATTPVPSATAVANTGGPWRAPQLPHGASPVAPAQYLAPAASQPATLAAQAPQQIAAPAVATMPVELHPAASPSTAPTVATAAPPPRMRFPSQNPSPSLLSPSTWFTPQPAAAPHGPLIGYMVPGPNGQMQMVSVEQMQAMQGGATQPAAEVANSDGFRARGTTTK